MTGSRRENKIRIISAVGDRDQFMVFISRSSKNLEIETRMI